MRDRVGGGSRGSAADGGDTRNVGRGRGCCNESWADCGSKDTKGDDRATHLEELVLWVEKVSERRD